MRPVRDATSHDYLPNLEYNFLVSCKIQSTLTLPGRAAASRVDQPQRSLRFLSPPFPSHSPPFRPDDDTGIHVARNVRCPQIPQLCAIHTRVESKFIWQIISAKNYLRIEI